MFSVNDFLPPTKRKRDETSADEGTKVKAQRHVADLTLAAPTKANTGASSLIPIQHQAGSDTNLKRPSESQVAAVKERTQTALEQVVLGRTSNSSKLNETQYVKYVPASVDRSAKARTVKIVDVQYDPLEPARHGHVKVPARPASPPVPVLKEAPKGGPGDDTFHIPPSISAWKNPKGYVISAEKRAAASGQTHQDIPEPGARLSALTDALAQAENKARTEVRERAAARAEQEATRMQEREAHLRVLALRARQERRAAGYTSRLEPSPSEDLSVRDRKLARAARRREAEDEYELLDEEQRDISQRVGLNDRTNALSGDAQFDSRLFAHAQKPSKEVYDRPLFAAQQAVRDIYVPKQSAVDAERDPHGRDPHGRDPHGRDPAPRLGPVEFEKGD